jgi:transposase-like protein
MAHKHHPKEARIRAVQQHDGGRPATDICKDMNITPGTLKRWGRTMGVRLLLMNG